MSKPGRYVPVDKAHVIPRVIFADFPEAHPTTLEGAVIFTGKNMPGKPLAFDFEFANFS